MCAKAEDGTHTLMKGDEVVEAGEEGANLTLFWRGRVVEIHVGYVLVVDMYY